MPTTITQGANTIAPQEVLSVSSEQTAGNIVHPILGRANPDVTLRPAGMRTGSIEMGFSGPNSETDSAAARALLAAGGVFTMTSTDRATVNMTFVASGRITRELEETTRNAWTISLDYQEVIQ